MLSSQRPAGVAALRGLVVALGLGLASAGQAALPLETNKDGYPTLSGLIKEVTPAVVNISVTTTVSLQQNPLFNDPFFRRFFNVPDQPQSRQRASAGSGVIVDAEKGYVMTNHHVIDNADTIQVTLKDRRSFEARLIGSDPATDIAVLEIDADNLVDIPFGDSDALEVGDFVVAVGNPFGIGQTVTSGIVSALGRSGVILEGYEDFIQTDASINPGNSGGALVSLAGELVGINTAIIGPAGGNVGIGFAVPSRMATAIMAQLIEHGEVQRGTLGVTIQDVTPDLAEILDVEVGRGALVSEVVPGSAAEKAGIQPGDVIIRVNGEEIVDTADLRNAIGLAPLDSEVRIEYVREGKTATLVARIQGDEERVVGGKSTGRLSGATFRDIESTHPRYGQVEGAWIADVQPESRAWRSGLRTDDIVVAVNRQRVRTVQELSDALDRVDGPVALRVVRGNRALYIVVQ